MNNKRECVGRIDPQTGCRVFKQEFINGMKNDINFKSEYENVLRFSISELIGDIEWGYNRDGEHLPQTNLCLLMGGISHLPVYQTSYSGSLKDVSTLKTTMEKFDIITSGKSVVTVTDKGFYSKDNIIVGGNTLRAAMREHKRGEKSITSFVYFNPTQHIAAKEKMFAQVSQMYENACKKPHKYAENKAYLKFLDIKKSDDIYTVVVNEAALENSYKHAGWFVIISNHVKNAKDAISIYRAKDVVEKGFLRLKNSLDLGRLRVHSDDAMHGKLFVGFIALILMSHIHSVMCDKDLYKKYTMKELIRVLSKRKIHKLAGERILSPLTKQQRGILEAFGL